MNNVPTTLVVGTDYTLGYDSTNNILRIVPSTAVWATGVYTITLNNSTDPIKDLVGNALQPNNNAGTTQFVVQISNTAVSAWQNPVNKYNVNNDNLISPNDALIVINKLLTGFAGTLASPTPFNPYIDVNGDGLLTANDALQVINYLNINGITSATPFSPGVATPGVATPGVVTPSVATSNSATSNSATSQAVTSSPATATAGTASSTAGVASAATATAASPALDFNYIVSSSAPAKASATPTASTSAAAAVDAAVAASDAGLDSSSSMDDALASALAADDWNESPELAGTLDDLTSDAEDPRLATII